ncbi:HEAT repeat domain-containing protein [Teredinibacter turnerae]|uniref:HEAT repeat domain-containing protein n=1 Tax=Teredinibacter turnerae TaxID=2426 RepID=UPI0013C49A7C|nr:HEAT repeat domain-containing protein [Teredinibacter turnerae]
MKSVLFTILLFIAGCTEEEMDMRTSEDKINYINQLSYSDDQKNIEKIAFYLADSDEKVLSMAAFGLGYLGAREYIPNLVALLKSESNQVVSMACSGLAQMVDKSDSDLLESIHPLFRHEFNLARISAIEVIEKIGHKSSIDYLVPLFAGATSGEKARIVSAFCEIGDKKVLPILEEYHSEVESMDFSQPVKGGTRGSNLHPTQLKTIVEMAISKIGK